MRRDSYGSKYDPKTTPWNISEQDFPHNGTEEERLRFFLRYAVLAPSGHNTQPWKFAIEQSTIQVYADPSRWLRVADADRRELHISVGCAIENLLIAADYAGYGSEVTYLPTPNQQDHMATIRLLPDHHTTPRYDPALFAAIPTRHTNHKEYDGRPVPGDVVRHLEACCEATSVTLFLADDDTRKQQVEALMREGDRRQFSDPAYRKELGTWIGRGVFGDSWLQARIGQLVVTYVNMGKTIAKKNARLLRSAPVLGVLATREDNAHAQMLVGQVFERVSLTAATLGLNMHPMSQPLELPDLRKKLTDLLPVSGLVPQHVVRLGYAEPEAAHTPRRPLEDILVSV